MDRFFLESKFSEGLPLSLSCSRFGFLVRGEINRDFLHVAQICLVRNNSDADEVLDDALVEKKTKPPWWNGVKDQRL